MGRPIPIRYDGKEFPSRAALAKHLAGITGRDWYTCSCWLRHFNDDPVRVIAYADIARSRAVRLSYEGRLYQQQELAQRLAVITGRKLNSCLTWLQRFDNDPVRAIGHAVSAPHNAMSVTIAGRTFPTQASFGRYLHHHYSVGMAAVSAWLCREHLSPEQCLERARAYRKKHRKPHEHTGGVALFGWHFRSPNALCTYYGIPHKRFLAEWRARQSGTPVERLPAVMRTIAQLWEIGRLDERNRQPPQIEARLPKSSLPKNAVLDEHVLTAYERAVLDCLQPADARTPRRDGLAWLARMRQRAAS